MANRLSVIATRTGDDGSTGLGDGSRIPKDATRIAALGDVDELNSRIGVLLAESLPEGVAQDLMHIQHDLFDIGAELCIPGHSALVEKQISQLDNRLAHYNEAPLLLEFILPGESRASALAHVARTACRRAERTIVALARDEPVQPTVGRYLNRLSDLMFVLARHLNRAAQCEDVLWKSPHSRTSQSQQASTSGSVQHI